MSSTALVPTRIGENFKDMSRYQLQMLDNLLTMLHLDTNSNATELLLNLSFFGFCLYGFLIIVNIILN